MTVFQIRRIMPKRILFVFIALMFGFRLCAQSIPDYSDRILTPPAPDYPQINCARIYGARPGSPIQFLIATSGKRPIQFSADGLPKGLVIDKNTGLIYGKISKRGDYQITLHARNQYGSDQRTLTISIGDKIALTPPMGWNSWNCWGKTVSQERVMSSAKAMVEKGLINYGYSYINIDDGWQGIRGGKYNAIQPNIKFPNIKELSDSIHNMNLKMGVYSTPWVITFAGHIGSTCTNADGKYPWIEEGHHNDIYKISTPDDPEGDRVSWKHHYFGEYSFTDNDAQQWAEWNVDYLKYDWYPNDYKHVKEMRESLDKLKRDIVFSLSGICLYANAQDWAELTNCFRTTYDISDSWQYILDIGFRQQPRWTAFNGPSHWTDPDMLTVGMVGWGDNLHYTKLTPDEQYTHISLWSLLSAPMLIGCDIAQLDPFTLNLLCNREVNDIDQDPLGIQAYPLFVEKDSDSESQIWVKPLYDGKIAIGLFNLSAEEMTIGFKPSDLGIFGTQTVRDVWCQKNIATINPKETYSVQINPHGCKLITITGNNR